MGPGNEAKIYQFGERNTEIVLLNDPCNNTLGHFAKSFLGRSN